MPTLPDEPMPGEEPEPTSGGEPEPTSGGEPEPTSGGEPEPTPAVPIASASPSTQPTQATQALAPAAPAGTPGTASAAGNLGISEPYQLQSFWLRDDDSATPGVLFSWRSFAAVPIGAVPLPGHATPSAQHFDVFAAELYPVSNILRAGLTSEIGFASNDSAGSHGDFFLAEAGSAGVQWPMRVTPYVEGSLGLGFLRRSLYNQDILTLLYTGGVDVGVAARLVGKATVAASIGWLRPVYHVAAGSGHINIYTDAFTFRLAIGF
jgi:hypothetical protein